MLIGAASSFCAMAATDDPMNGRYQAFSFSGLPKATAGSYTHDRRFAEGYDIFDMIDVSTHNGNINWESVYASGIRYAMIRIGYRGYTQGGIFIDDMALENLENAKKAGIKVGVYFYTQAISTREAKEEADFAVKTLNGMKLDLPVAFDCEYAESSGKYTGRFYEANLSKTRTTDLCLAFCDRVKASGYDAMVYANPFMLTEHINADTVSAKYPVWLAAYRSSANYSGDYIMWQYSSKGKVSGISGYVDVNYYYVKKSGSEPVTEPVVDPEPENEYIRITSEDISQLSGNSFQLFAYTNDKALREFGGTVSEVAWSSSDSAVASVDENGIVTAVAPGRAEITATVMVTIAPPEEPDVPAEPDDPVIPEQPSGDNDDPEIPEFDIPGSEEPGEPEEPVIPGAQVMTFSDKIVVNISDPDAEPEPEPVPGEDDGTFMKIIDAIINIFIKIVNFISSLFSSGA